MLIPTLGGLRVSWNFLKVIGQRMQDAGLNVMWIESDLLGGTTTEHVMAGNGLGNGQGETCSQNHYSINMATASATTNELSSRIRRCVADGVYWVLLT